MAPDARDYNLWQFLKETRFSVDSAQDMLYRYSFAYMILNQFSNLDSLVPKTEISDSPYLFLETKIPKENKVEIHQGLDFFLKLVPNLRMRDTIILDNTRLVGRLAGTPGEVGIIDFNPQEEYSNRHVKGFYGQLESAPNHLLEKYLQGFEWKAI
jgi:hypothetical protein